MLNAWTQQHRRRESSGGGSAGVLATLSNGSGEASTPSPACEYALLNTGMVDWIADTHSAEYSWLLTGTVADFEVRCTLLSGSLSSGSSATASWLSLSTSRSWKRIKNIGAASTLMQIEIRRTADFVTVASAQIALSYSGADDFGTE